MSLPVFLCLLIMCCGYALIRGGSPERVAAGLQLGAFALGLPVHILLEGAGYESAILGTAIIDALLLSALVLLAARSTRFWPLYVAGWQLAAIVAHLAKLLDPGIMPIGYAVQAQFWAYPMLLAMAAGTWRHRARLQAGDPDPAWKPRRPNDEVFLQR